MLLSGVLSFPAIPAVSRKNLRAVLKALSWRAVGALDTLLISFFLSGSLALASGIMSIEIFTKVALYVAHEKAWERFR